MLSAPIEHTETGESDCILAANESATVSVTIGAGELGWCAGEFTELGVSAEVGTGTHSGALLSGDARIATGL